MNATEKTGTIAVTAVPAAPKGFKLKPAARRQFLLQTLRGRAPRDPVPPKTS
jgi:hypothetical protein